MKNFIEKYLNTVLIALVLIAVLVGGKQSGLLGGTTNYDSLSLSGNLTVAGVSSLATTTTTYTILYSSSTYSGTLIDGGGITSTSSAIGLASLTLTAADFDTENIISITTGTSTTLTVTLPASSTITTLASIGDHRSLLVYAASSTAGTITLAAGAGTTLMSTASTSAKVIPAGGMAQIDIFKVSATALLAKMNIAQ